MNRNNLWHWKNINFHKTYMQTKKGGVLSILRNTLEGPRQLSAIDLIKHMYSVLSDDNSVVSFLRFELNLQMIQV